MSRSNIHYIVAVISNLLIIVDSEQLIHTVLTVQQSLVGMNYPFITQNLEIAIEIRHIDQED